ncbi:glycoside hydrolase family 76 protein [Paludibacter sp.]
MNLYTRFVSISLIAISLLFSIECCVANNNFERAKATYEAIYKHYSIEGSHLLRETFPFSDSHKVTYLDNSEQADKRNEYSYLWPYSGSLSATSSLYEVKGEAKYKKLFNKKVIAGLEMYWDTLRQPGAYASYIKINPLPDRFYDDNIWIGIDFTDMFIATKNKSYLAKAEYVWKFIESGTDKILGDGIYWVEQRKGSKHACSNAPGAVYAAKLFIATKNQYYLRRAIELYSWTKKNLQDSQDYLIYDNIRINGSVDKKKYAYNSGQMLQAASLLFKLTKDASYLDDAKNIAESSFKYFFKDTSSDGQLDFNLLKTGDIWFTAVMLRGYIELFDIERDSKYIDTFKKNLDYAWKYMREDNGLFNSDWSGKKKDNSKWLLTQFAMVEMYARISKL